LIGLSTITFSWSTLLHVETTVTYFDTINAHTITDTKLSDAVCNFMVNIFWAAPSHNLVSTCAPNLGWTCYFIFGIEGCPQNTHFDDIFFTFCKNVVLLSLGHRIHLLCWLFIKGVLEKQIGKFRAGAVLQRLTLLLQSSISCLVTVCHSLRLAFRFVCW
jgi:hypothetical protein